jgi:hypothetical protein
MGVVEVEAVDQGAVDEHRIAQRQAERGPEDGIGARTCQADERIDRPLPELEPARGQADADAVEEVQLRALYTAEGMSSKRSSAAKVASAIEIAPSLEGGASARSLSTIGAFMVFLRGRGLCGVGIGMRRAGWLNAAGEGDMAGLRAARSRSSRVRARRTRQWRTGTVIIAWPGFVHPLSQQRPGCRLRVIARAGSCKHAAVEQALDQLDLAADRIVAPDLAASSPPASRPRAG